MSVKKRLISLFFSICVLVALMFQSAHTYSHLISDYLDAGAHHDKSPKALTHHADDCQICHFTFSPFTAVSSEAIVFFTTTFYPKLNVPGHFDLVSISVGEVSLRGPPAFIK